MALAVSGVASPPHSRIASRATSWSVSPAVSRLAKSGTAPHTSRAACSSANSPARLVVSSVPSMSQNRTRGVMAPTLAAVGERIEPGFRLDRVHQGIEEEEVPPGGCAVDARAHGVAVAAVKEQPVGVTAIEAARHERAEQLQGPLPPLAAQVEQGRGDDRGGRGVGGLAR